MSAVSIIFRWGVLLVLWLLLATIRDRLLLTAGWQEVSSYLAVGAIMVAIQQAVFHRRKG